MDDWLSENDNGNFKKSRDLKIKACIKNRLVRQIKMIENLILLLVTEISFGIWMVKEDLTRVYIAINIAILSAVIIYSLLN